MIIARRERPYGSSRCIRGAVETLQFNAVQCNVVDSCEQVGFIQRRHLVKQQDIPQCSQSGHSARRQKRGFQTSLRLIQHTRLATRRHGIFFLGHSDASAMSPHMVDKDIWVATETRTKDLDEVFAGLEERSGIHSSFRHRYLDI